MEEEQGNGISRREFMSYGSSAVIASAMAGKLVSPAAAADLPKPGPADWPRYCYDLQNTGFNPKETTIGKSNVDRLKMKWKFDVKVPLETGPTVIGDTVFFGAPGAYYALDSQTGQQKWMYEMPAKASENVRRGVQYYKGRIYSGDWAGFIRCLDAATGKQIWERDFSAPEGNREHLFSSACLAYNDKIYSGTVGNKNRVLCLHADTGITSWEYYITGEHDPGKGGSMWTSPAIDEKEKILYMTTGSNKMVGAHDPALFTESVLAFDADTGYLRWFYQAHPNDVFDLDFGNRPILFDAQAPPMKRGSVRQCVAAANKDGVYCLDRYTGELLWRVQLTSSYHYGGPITDGSAFAYNKYYVVSNAATQLIGKPPISVTAALDSYTGRIVWWTYTVEGVSVGAIAIANGVMYQGFNDGRVQGLDADTGKVLWEHKLPTSRKGGLTVANGALYCSTGIPGAEQQGGGPGWNPTEMVENFRKAGTYSVYCFTVDGK